MDLSSVPTATFPFSSHDLQSFGPRITGGVQAHPSPRCDNPCRVTFCGYALLSVRLDQPYRQNPVECIFSFICSSNNNIPRITSMLEKLRRTYGDLLLSVGEGGLAATGALGNIEVSTVR